MDGKMYTYERLSGEISGRLIDQFALVEEGLRPSDAFSYLAATLPDVAGALSDSFGNQ